MKFLIPARLIVTAPLSICITSSIFVGIRSESETDTAAFLYNERAILQMKSCAFISNTVPQNKEAACISAFLDKFSMTDTTFYRSHAPFYSTFKIGSNPFSKNQILSISLTINHGIGDTALLLNGNQDIKHVNSTSNHVNEEGAHFTLQNIDSCSASFMHLNTAGGLSIIKVGHYSDIGRISECCIIGNRANETLIRTTGKWKLTGNVFARNHYKYFVDIAESLELLECVFDKVTPDVALYSQKKIDGSIPTKVISVPDYLNKRDALWDGAQNILEPIVISEKPIIVKQKDAE